MTVHPSETAVRTSIVVDAPIERAFSVFTEDFGSFKPPEHNMLGVEIAATVFEPREGGHLYDRGVDGSECRWARVLAYEPPDRVVISWDIGPEFQVETDLSKTSEVEVRFSLRARSAFVSSSSTATSIATARVGMGCAPQSTPRVGGRSTWSDSPRSLERRERSAPCPPPAGRGAGASASRLKARTRRRPRGAPRHTSLPIARRSDGHHGDDLGCT